MKSSTKDQVKGKFHEVKGAIKEATGKIIDNPKLDDEGNGEKVAGKMLEKVGQIEKVLGE